jgi:hypothetical protein
MKRKISFAFFTAVVVVLSLVVLAQTSRKNTVQTSTKATDQVGHSKVLAYYFHGTVRCMTCKKIESLSHDVVASDFAGQLKTGDLEWKVVNVDLPENEHFIKDYQLVTRSLVLVKYENGKQVGYKNLQDIWRLVNNEQAFRNYVKVELQATLGRG